VINGWMRTKRNRGGSVYIIVLATAMLVTVVGLASIYAGRLQTRTRRLANDLADARNYAHSAVELGMLWIKLDPGWRKNFSPGPWFSDRPIGRGTFSLEVADPTDGEIGDSPYDPVTLTGIGEAGRARHKVQVTLDPDIRPLELLRTAMHAHSQLKVKSGASITALEGPVSTNGVLDNAGIIDGDVEAAVVNRRGVISGDIVVPSPSKTMPAPGLVDSYIAKATPIPYTGTIVGSLLGAGYNPWGASDPGGVYYMNTHGNDVTIKGMRLSGTLIIRTGGKTVYLDEAVFFQNYQSNYPVLIVDGNLEVRIRSEEYPLRETDYGINFNPVQVPCDGEWDNDLIDEYPNEIRGLVHVTGVLTLEKNSRFKGILLSEDTIVVEGMNTVTRDQGLYENPPEGYTEVVGMKVAPGTWKQLVD